MYKQVTLHRWLNAGGRMAGRITLVVQNFTPMSFF